MHHDYSCIRSRIAEEPRWFDEDGVPRYAEFTPRETANIYARQALLLLIECQNCGREFQVCMSWQDHEAHFGGSARDLAARVTDGTIHYGDPPNVACCLSGPTMNSVPRRVLEFWRTGHIAKWERVADLERVIDAEWTRDTL